MLKDETLHVRVNKYARRDAEKKLKIIGISLSEVINMLLHQINSVGSLPVIVKIPSAPTNIFAHNDEELYEMLEIGSEQINNGNVTDAEIVMARIKDEYGFSD